MRAVAEVRERLLEELRFTVWRPTMRGGNADAVETLLSHLLDTLCFIDRREDDMATAMSKFVQGCRRVPGQFEYQHLPFPQYINEVASVYAEFGASLGYIRPTRLLTEGEMARLVTEVNRTEFRTQDWTEERLQAGFGPPSHVVVGGNTTVMCYGCDVPAVKWVFFDMACRLPWVDNWLPVPLLRNLRIDHNNQMHLLPTGKRWVSGE